MTIDEFENKLREGFLDKEYITAPNRGSYRVAIKDSMMGCWRYWPHSRAATFICGFNGIRFENFDQVIQWAKADGRHEPGTEGTPLSQRTLIE